ncbi:MAG TPA: DNA starvation/stationary phase protection protein [Candidatus Limnocylindrales bacterium]|jgi:starvation-inducible DNA-binding protein
MIESSEFAIPHVVASHQPDAAVDDAALLQSTLIELIDLSLMGKHAHWNVVGADFKPVHEFLDELVEEYRDWYDMVAERLTALGASPDGQCATVAATTHLPPLPGGPLADKAVLVQFSERVQSVAANVRLRAGALGDSDLASQDLLVEVLRGLDKQGWMLQAHLR